MASEGNLPDIQDANDEAPSTERGLEAFANRNVLSGHQLSPTQQPEASTINVPKGMTRFCNMEYWQQYFNISQDEVISRIVQSVKPMKPQFLRVSKNNPDLYGPFWIMTTIIVLVSLTGNLARFLKNIEHSSKFEFRLELVRYAVFVVYGYGIGFPAALGAAMQYLNSPLTAVNVVCLYGYSMSTFLGICVLCIIPSPVLHWLLILYGVINSTALVLSNLRTEIEKFEILQRRILYGAITFVHITFLLLFKLVFYNINYKV